MLGCLPFGCVTYSANADPDLSGFILPISEFFPRRKAEARDVFANALL